VDQQVRKLWSKKITLVKVVWKGHPCEEATWKLEEEMLNKYP